MPSLADPRLTLDQAADALGTGPDFITYLIATGQLDHLGQGDELVIPQSALIAYAITAGDPARDTGSLATPELSATAEIHDVHGFVGREVAA